MDEVQRQENILHSDLLRVSGYGNDEEKEKVDYLGASSPLIRAINRVLKIRSSRGRILQVLRDMKTKWEGAKEIDASLAERLMSSSGVLFEYEAETIDLAKEIVKDLFKDDYKLIIAYDSKTRDYLSVIKGSLCDCNRVPSAEDTLTELKAMSRDEFINDFEKVDLITEERGAFALMNSELRKILEEDLTMKKKELEQKTRENTILEGKLTLESAKLASQKLAFERSAVERKQRQLERLRKEASKRGYLHEKQTDSSLTSGAASIGASSSELLSSASNSDENESNAASPKNNKGNLHNNKSNNNSKKGGNSNITACKDKDCCLCARSSINSEKEAIEVLGAKLDELGLRIPPISPLPVPDSQVSPPVSEYQSQSQKSSPKGNENKNDIHYKISSRLASFAQRKQRMRQLRSQINSLQNQHKMEETYKNALSRMQNLTEMRQTLESYLTSSKEDTEASSTGQEKGDENNELNLICGDSTVENTRMQNERDSSGTDVGTEQFVTEVEVDGITEEELDRRNSSVSTDEVRT